MSDWTPNTDDVRMCYGAGVSDGADCAPRDIAHTPRDTDPEFDRWLAAEKAQAWREGVDRVWGGSGLEREWLAEDYEDDNPYSKRDTPTD